MPAEIGKRRNLMAPGEPALGKPMQKQRDIVAVAGLVDQEGESSRLDPPLTYLRHDLAPLLAPIPEVAVGQRLTTGRRSRHRDHARLLQALEDARAYLETETGQDEVSGAHAPSATHGKVIRLASDRRTTSTSQRLNTSGAERSGTSCKTERAMDIQGSTKS